jgi:hypothetical protein
VFRTKDGDSAGITVVKTKVSVGQSTAVVMTAMELNGFRIRSLELYSLEDTRGFPHNTPPRNISVLNGRNPNSVTTCELTHNLHLTNAAQSILEASVVAFNYYLQNRLAIANYDPYLMS